MWGVSRKNLDFFSDEISTALEDDAQLISQPDEDSQTLHFGSAEFNPNHYPERYGPSVRQTMKHFIKPKLPPGSSWALTQNPQKGLMCDAFATHCWDEGIFEFVVKALANFPPKAQGMYICFLSNPQDDETLKECLNVGPSAIFARGANWGRAARGGILVTPPIP